MWAWNTVVSANATRDPQGEIAVSLFTLRCYIDRQAWLQSPASNFTPIMPTPCICVSYQMGKVVVFLKSLM